MHILTVGLNYKTAPVEIREKLTFEEARLPEALARLRDMKSVLECVIVATCNRTELYAVVDQLHTGRHFVRSFMEKWFGLSREQFDQHLYIHESDEAVRHLFRVVSGLDSMVLGETQILGQVRDAFSAAQAKGTTGTIFNMLFKQAVTLGKRAHSETAIGENAVSVSYAAIELAKKIFGSFSEKSVLILGAGKMSELTAKHLYSNGVPRVVVVNRTFARAEELAIKFQGEAYPIERLKQALTEVDIVISSTGANEAVLTKADMESVMKLRRNRPIFMIDIALPRDLDPAINELTNIYLYDIDDLQGIVDYNLQERQKEALKISEMISIELGLFNQWVHTLGVVPVIKALRDKALSIQEETMRSMENKLPNLSERELTVIRKHTKSIVNQLLRDPILRIKELAAESNSAQSIALFSELFALESLLEEEMQTEVPASSKERQGDGLAKRLPSFEVSIRL